MSFKTFTISALAVLSAALVAFSLIIALIETELVRFERAKLEIYYKCPDLNGDGLVDIYDNVILNSKIDSCQGDPNYDEKTDLNGDGCITMTDLEFFKKYFGKTIGEIPECEKEMTLKSIEEEIASIADEISQIINEIQKLLKQQMEW